MEEPQQVLLSEPEALAQSDEDSDVPEEFKATFKKKAESLEMTSDKENEGRNSSEEDIDGEQPEEVLLSELSELDVPFQSDEDSDVPEEFKVTFNKKKKKADSDEDWSPQTSDKENEGRDSSSEEDGDGEQELSKHDETSSRGHHPNPLCTECGSFYLYEWPHTCAHIKRPSLCNMCGRRYATEESLKKHMKSHTNNFEHSCVYCYATIITQQDKLLHQQFHQTQSHPYRCRHCDGSFSSISERNRCVKSHKGRLQFNCDVCGNNFYGSNQLARHMVVHTGVKPFQCTVCERSFNQEGHLKSHMRLHTGERPYACPHCDKAFNHNVSLKSHIQRYHPSECGDREDSSCDGAVNKSDTRELRETEPGSEQKQQVQPKHRKSKSGRPIGRPKRPRAETAVMTP